MKGFNLYYPFEFDDNRLPTKLLVEKRYGIKAHEITREQFTELCLKETVFGIYYLDFFIALR